ncbi:MAG: carbohydrate kinase family protein [Patescibacteria group bacterium]
MKYDFIAIGDVVTDAFIRLLPESAELQDGPEKKLCFLFGEKVPFENSYVIPAVGNSANAAVAASRLGLSTAFVTNIGDDRAGDETIERLKTENIIADYVIKQKGKVTNYHYVLWYQDDRTILIKHEAYEYHLPALEEPRWIYFSSVGAGALRYHDEVVAYMQVHPNVKLAFQPGTFQIKQGAGGLADVYKHSEIIMCNREEAQAILGIDNPDIATLACAMHVLGPKIVVITDGIKGAYASQGGTIWFMRNYPDPKPPYERTGAGDAFSSTLVVALALGKSLEEALMWAPINSMSVVQYVGAQQGLLRKSALERYLASAPRDYKPIVFAKI